MNSVNFSNLKHFLNQKVDLYNCQGFIADDPISVPHRFTRKEDIEIIGFLRQSSHGDKGVLLLINAWSYLIEWIIVHTNLWWGILIPILKSY